MDLVRLSYCRRSLLLTVCWFSLLTLLLAGCGGSGSASDLWSGAAGSPEAGRGGAMTLAPQPVLATPTPSPLPTVSVHSGSAPLPPGAVLPTEGQCTASVAHSFFEPRPANAVPNSRAPSAQELAGLTHWGPTTGQSPQADTLRQQISGNYTGTTDAILQWVACKWGFDPDIVRAQAVVESYWRQLAAGDYTSSRKLCPPGMWDGRGCYQTYGILQIKYTYYPTTWPMSHYDTAFSAEFMYAEIRACFEGWDVYLQGANSHYQAGDLWGCIGRWYSGSWYDGGAVNYIYKVKSALAHKTWLQQNFAGA